MDKQENIFGKSMHISLMVPPKHTTMSIKNVIVNLGSIRGPSKSYDQYGDGIFFLKISIWN